MPTLVIVESPAKCAKIGGFLGADYVVVATYGHIRALEEGLEFLGIPGLGGSGGGDFDAKYHFLNKEKAKAIKGLKEAAEGCTRIILAADDDREGEAIAYSACLLLKQNPATVERAVFHEITREAVCGAVSAPRRLDMNKVWAQQARAILDMMVGFTISPLLWKHVGSGLSAGRCQTPALRLVYEREEEIRDFKAASSWLVNGLWVSGGIGGAVPFRATLTDELEDEESAVNYLENHSSEQSAAATVVEAETRPWKESAPVAFITSTLQQQASALFRAGPKQTMQSAQRLYEEGHITYMRTDNAAMSEEAVVAARKQVEELYGEKYLGSDSGSSGSSGKATEGEATVGPKRRGPKKKEVATAVKAQEAHEAIRPTHFDLTELGADRDWNYLDKKLYKLIWTRAMQSVMAPVEGEKRTVRFVVEGDEEAGFKWEATWKRTTFEGWRKAGAAAAAIDDEGSATATTTQENSWSTGAALGVGTKLIWKELSAQPHTTKAPGRYNEATLVRELEKRGIGRPSTFAMLTETIQEKKYVEKKNIEGREVTQKSYTLGRIGQWPPSEEEKKVRLGAEKDKLIPTGLGCSVVDFALQHFGDLFDYTFTATMESRLDKIAAGSEVWKKVLHDTWNSYKERYFSLKSAKAAAAGGEEDRRRDMGDGLVAIQTRKGPLLMREGATKDDTKFYGWPSGVAFAALSPSEAAEFVAGRDKVFGEHEGEPIHLKEGRYGKYCVWRDLNVPYKVGESVGDIIKKLEGKVASAASGKSVGPFDIRNGPYGLYMFKRDAVKKQFVSVPAGINIDTLTVAAATVIFQKGLEAKAKGKAIGAQRFKKKEGGDV